MDSVSEQIISIEKEIRETPYHKGTEHHIGKLKARLSQLKDKQIQGLLKKGGGGGKTFAIKQQGDATVVLVGPPSAGKSSLLNVLTNAESKVAPYAFTTVTVIPGMLFYNDAYIQILDVPGLIRGASLGKGRGREVLSVVRTADLLIIMTDPERVDQIENIVSELESTGIRINKHKKQVLISKKIDGGLEVHSNIKQAFGSQTVKEIAKEFGIINGKVVFKEKVNLDELVDSFNKRVSYIPALLVINKIDTKPGIVHQPGYLYISSETQEGVEELKEHIWRTLGLVRIYLVREGDNPDAGEPMIVRSGFTLKEVALHIGEEFAKDKKFAKIWGNGAKFPGQEVSLQTSIKEDMRISFLSS